MKKLYSILFSAIVSAIFAPLATSQVTLPTYSAQELDKQVHYSDAGGLCYSKTISQPQADGTYWITLESFVTGEVDATTGGDKPVDLILVLDVSSSMVQHRGSYSSTTKSLSYNDVTPDLEDYDTQNPKTNYLYTSSHVQLFGEKDGNNYYLYYVAVGGTQKQYLRSNGQGTTNKSQAAKATDPNTPIISNLAVYTGSSRIRELQNAVIAFIDEVYKNSWYKKDGSKRTSQLKHAISIITYATDPTTVLDLTVLPENEDDLLPIKDKVNDFPLRSGTNGGRGVATANAIYNSQKNGSDDAKRRYATATRSIVMFTDGEQRDEWAAVGQASTSKKTHNASVFAVCMFDTSSDSYNTNKRNMEYISSNYPDATSVSEPGTKIQLEEGDPGYFFDASSETVNLTDVFVSIAGSSSGGADGDWGETTVSQVDIVSADFTLPAVPDGVDIASLVKVYVAPFKGTYVKKNGVEETYSVTIDGRTFTRKYLEFKTPETIDGCLSATDHVPFIPMTDDSGNIVKPYVTVTGKNTITVQGFDYGENWCGIETVDGVPNAHGHKLIVLIPIQMSEASTGGPGTATNVPGSGLFAVDSEGHKTKIVDFVSPLVNLPINIRINKQGLKDGESAKFLIQRSTTPAVEESWENVTSVFVTRHANQGTDDAITSVIGLPATDEDNQTFVYRIVEEQWGWSYYPVSFTHKLTDGRVYLLNTDQDYNPFIFFNKSKENIDVKVRHAESKVTNTFKTGGKAEYDDSKENNRKEIGETE